jgi:hypothetical protein
MIQTGGRSGIWSVKAFVKRFLEFMGNYIQPIDAIRPPGSMVIATIGTEYPEH